MATSSSKDLGSRVCLPARLRCRVWIGSRASHDDFLFSVASHSSGFAVVHHTWSVDTRPDWPWTTLFESAHVHGTRAMLTLLDRADCLCATCAGDNYLKERKRPPPSGTGLSGTTGETESTTLDVLRLFG